jgi:hypothetical protein
VTGGGAGQPHILFVDPADGDAPARLTYATRTRRGWSLQVVAEDRHDTACAESPRAFADRCVQVYIVHTPVAVLTSGTGDVRFLYSRSERIQAFRAACSGERCSSNCLQDGCYWASENEFNIDAVCIARGFVDS